MNLNIIKTSSNGVTKIFNTNEIRKISKELPIFAPS